MFDFAFSEMLLAALVALVVLGPERLPKLARAAGHWLGRVQQFVGNMKSELSQQADLAEWRQMKAEWSAAAEQLRGEVRQLREAADLPAWERLPEQRTPADFGLADDGSPLPKTPQTAGFRPVSLRRQALARRRQMRPKPLAAPRLRARSGRR